ncbi:hypothetical protein UlMin_014884 [Ulmus minor]
MAATNNFSPENVIISTSSGTTYKAVLPNRSVLAIKRLNTCTLSEKQFHLEINRLGQLRHPNLTPILGFCVVEEEKLLVYKYLSNRTLRSLLNGNGNELDWGLAWLHHGCHPPIIHQKICSNVILIDEDFYARIMDFGLARLMASDANESSFVNGDLGYTMVASIKGDAYGFGVVLLELATGQKPLEVSTMEEEFKGKLVDWDVINKALLGKGHNKEILQVLKIACNCVVSQLKDRWFTYQVYQSLKSMNKDRDFSEQDDEFPLIFGKQENP